MIMNRKRVNTPDRIAKHDIMYKIKDLCRTRHFRDALKYSRNLIKYSKYAELIIIYGSLATKFNRSLLNYMHTLTIPECAYLIKQYADVNLEGLNLHADCQIFLSFVLNILVARLLVNRMCSSAKLSIYLKMWIDKHLCAPDFKMSLRKFIELADECAPRNLFIIFGTLHAYNFEAKYYLFALKWEVLVRAITFKLNSFEAMKMKTELNETDLLAEECKLSKLYIQLAGFCAYNPAVQFEFLLTAFSLYPTAHLYDLIKDRRNNIRNNWTDGLFSGRIFDRTGIRTTNELHEQLGTDIVTILMAARNKLILSHMEWPILDANLKQLLNTEFKLNFVKQYKSDANSYLKFINLDYTQFREKPQEEDALDRMDTVGQDIRVEDDSNTIEVTNGDVYGFNNVLQMNDSQMENQLLPSVFIVPLSQNTTNRNNKYVRINRRPKFLTDLIMQLT